MPFVSLKEAWTRLGSRQWFSRHAFKIVAWPLGALLAFRHFQLRFVSFRKALWFDETMHNTNTLAPANFWALREAMRFEYQPLLDYALRKYFWFPWFGHQELGLRLPSLVYSLMASVLVFVMALKLFRRTVKDEALALLGAGMVGLWLAHLGLETVLATEARHYSLVILMSTAWFSFYLFFFTPDRWPLFFFVTLLFLNAHFFSFPFVVVGLAWEVLSKVRSGEFTAARRLTVFTLAAVTFTVALNLPAFSQLVFVPPSQGIPDPSVSGRLGEVVSLMSGLIHLGGLGWVIFGFALSNLIRPRSGDRAALFRLMVLSMGVLPVFLFFMRSSAKYHFSDRYYAPFLGLVVAWVFVAGRVLLGFADAALQKVGRANSPWMSALTLGALLAFLLQQNVAHRSLLRPPPQNFTDTAAMFSYLKGKPRPTLFVASPCRTMVLIDFYYRYIGGAPPQSLDRSKALAQFGKDTRCVNASLLKGSSASQRIETMLKSGPLTVVLAEWSNRCEKSPPALRRGEMTVRRVYNYRANRGEESCFFVLEGVRALAQIRDFAVEQGLPMVQKENEASPYWPDLRSVAALR